MSTMSNHSASPGQPDDAALPADELSDSDLEQVVGGLSRTWHLADRAFVEPAPPAVSATPLTTVPMTGFLTPEIAHRVAI